MEKVSAADLVEYDQRGFFNNGIQYYAAARMLFFARGAPVTGNLAHHAVEMLLKGALCRVVPLTALAKPREFGHSLTRLWERFKTELKDATLARFDDTIAALDPWETLRYPDEVRGFMLRLSISPPPPALEMPPLSEPRTERTFEAGTSQSRRARGVHPREGVRASGRSGAQPRGVRGTREGEHDRFLAGKLGPGCAVTARSPPTPRRAGPRSRAR